MANDSEIENVIPILRLMEAVRGVVDRDVNLGLYKPETVRLTVEARKEAVKMLADQGLSTRQIGTIVGVDHSTVVRDLVQNAPPSGAKRTTKKDQLIEEAKTEAREELREAYEKEKQAHEAEIVYLQEQLKKQNGLKDRNDVLESQLKTQRKEAEENLTKLREDLARGPPPSDFAKEVGQLTGPLTKFIQHDNLVNMLIELENQKEDRTGDWDMPELERVIRALLSLSKRAQSWAERLTPTNDKWKNRIHSYFEEGATL